MIEITLTAEERIALQKSAAAVQELVDILGIENWSADCHRAASARERNKAGVFKDIKYRKLSSHFIPLAALAVL